MATASVVPSILYFIAPLFTTALGGIALANRASYRGNMRSPAERATAYAMIAALAVASTLVGALSLGDAQAHGSGRTKAAAALQALLGLLVGVPVLHLCAYTSTADGSLKLRLGFRRHLRPATLLALLAPFLPAAAQPARLLGPALFLTYTILTLPRVIRTLAARPAPAPRAPATFPKIESRGASPAFNADFGFDPGARAPASSPATLRTFQFPPSPSGPTTAPSSFCSFFPPPLPALLPPAARTRLATIPATPSPTSSTSSHIYSPPTPKWLGSLSSLRSQVSVGALRSKKKAVESPAGTVRRPITIHVATERTSWGHEAEAEGQTDVGASGGVRVRMPSPTPSSEESHARTEKAVDDGEIGMPRIVYPPRQHQRQRSATTGSSRTSAASTSASHILEVKTLGIPPPLTPIESDIEQQYRARERKYEGLGLDLDLDARDFDLDIDAESSDEGGPHSFGQFAIAGKRRSLSGPAQRGALVDARGGARRTQTVAHVALPTIRTHLGSRFSTGDDPVPWADDDSAAARGRRARWCVLGAQLVSGVAWACALGAACVTPANSGSRSGGVHRACGDGDDGGVFLGVLFPLRDRWACASTGGDIVRDAVAAAGRAGQRSRPRMRHMLTSVVSFPTAHAASRDEPMDMRLASGRRAGDGAWARSFGEGSRSKANFGDTGAVTMDMALHSAFPTSAMAYGYSVNSPTVVEGWESANIENKDYAADNDITIITTNTQAHTNESDGTGFNNTDGHIDFSSTDYSTARYASARAHAVSYTPPPSAYPQTITIQRGASRSSAAAIRLATPPPPRTRRRRDASMEHNTPNVYRHRRTASASTRVSSSEGGHAHDALLPAAAVAEREAWGTSADGDAGLEGVRIGGLLPAEERGLLQRTGISAPVRARRASAAPRRRSAAVVVGAHVRAGSNGLGAGTGAARHRTHTMEDPGAYIRKRGSAPPTVRRFFGWEFGREASGSAPQPVGGEEQEASFIDLRGRNVNAKRQSLLSGIVSLASGGGSGAVVDGGKALVRMPSKLRRRSRERSRVEGVVVPSVAPDSPSALAFCLGRLGSRTSQRAPAGNAPMPRSPEAAPRAIQLKKTFRLGVGRTMGPGLTLAVAAEEEPVEEEMTPAMRERQRYYNTERAREAAAAAVREWVFRAEEEKAEGRAEGSVEGPETSTEEGADDDGEVQSIATARLVSASIARATPAATIVTAPGTPLRAAYRASYSSGYTASPTQETTPRGPGCQSLAGAADTYGYVSPQSPQSPGMASIARMQNSDSGEGDGNVASPRRASWKPHPFADPLEEVIEKRATIVENAPGPEAEVEDDDDDMVQLEREMAEMNAQNAADDERELRDLNASLSAAPAPEAAQDGRAQKRLTMSSPPAPKSDWALQAAAGNGFAYRFPMIFGASSASSSRSDSPPHAILSPQPFQQVQQPSTPRSTPNLRLSSRTMDTVRSAFAGVGARMSSATSRMSVTSSVVATQQREGIPQAVSAIAEDSDGDFMDLRDPFAPPPPATTALPKAVAKRAKGTRQWDNFLVIDAYEPEEAEAGAGVGGGVAKGARARRRRMSAWGRLPMPARALSPVPSSGGASVATGAPKKGTKAANRLSRGKTGVRKTKKEKRTRKATLSNVTGALASAKAAGSRSGEEDADFGIEEALLSQRLLRRLNSTEWEILSS
ncbi:hypothetical protein HYPSUDRAFT_74656 [Hypholoma sublateritium FD-334 SS-4]|uniref:Uncharacterized protein n=1 Tax=Hypholoma sublateritium (strain FD-334 SS-4) TaxID=945553 RepID=A0A0D2PGD7_HYPSF|nr:hypothetical protein HYPSUDRAFT_74656 [Hypholoma sublateritium FD-334 SS-4]